MAKGFASPKATIHIGDGYEYLKDHLLHACLDFVLQPLKIGAAIGIMLNDPLGNHRFCFTPCASYMVDTQEALMLAGVAGKTSHLTVANYKNFGDPF